MESYKFNPITLNLTTHEDKVKFSEYRNADLGDMFIYACNFTTLIAVHSTCCAIFDPLPLRQVAALYHVALAVIYWAVYPVVKNLGDKCYSTHIVAVVYIITEVSLTLFTHYLMGKLDNTIIMTYTLLILGYCELYSYILTPSIRHLFYCYLPVCYVCLVFFFKNNYEDMLE